MKNIDIVILSYAKDEKLKKVTEYCINTLLKSETNFHFDIVVVESMPGIVYNAPVKTLHLINEPVFNYNRFANAGIDFGHNENIVFCNNDLEFKRGWATELFKYDYDSMSPISLTSGSQAKFRQSKQPIFGYDIAQHISGWCIATKRSIWKAIGGLNEDYTFWFSDNIYAEQLKQHKLDHFLVPTSVVNHLDGGSNTLNTVDRVLKEDMTYNQARKYNKKYGTNHFNLNGN